MKLRSRTSQQAVVLAATTTRFDFLAGAYQIERRNRLVLLVITGVLAVGLAIGALSGVMLRVEASSQRNTVEASRAELDEVQVEHGEVANTGGQSEATLTAHIRSRQSELGTAAAQILDLSVQVAALEEFAARHGVTIYEYRLEQIVPDAAPTASQPDDAAEKPSTEETSTDADDTEPAAPAAGRPPSPTRWTLTATGTAPEFESIMAHNDAQALWLETATMADAGLSAAFTSVTPSIEGGTVTAPVFDIAATFTINPREGQFGELLAPLTAAPDRSDDTTASEPTTDEPTADPEEQR